MLVDTEEQAVRRRGPSQETKKGCPRARAFKPGEAVVTSPMKTALHEEGCDQQGQAFWRQGDN